MTTKIERLINLIAILSDTLRPLTQNEIVNTVPGYNTSSKATSRRTFERDKEELRKLGFDISQTPTPTGDYGYRINKNNTFYSVSLTPAQRNIVGCAIAMYSPSETISSKSLTKLGGANPENDLESVISLGVPENIDLLFKLCSKSASISFTYRDSIRKVKTKKLVARGGFWYLECLDLEKNEKRNFRLDRLTDIKEIDPKTIASTAIITSDIELEEETFVTILVEVHPDLKKLFIKDWHATELASGEVSFKVPRTELFTIRYFDYVGYVKVLEPIELKNQIDQTFESIISDLEGAK